MFTNSAAHTPASAMAVSIRAATPPRPLAALSRAGLLLLLLLPLTRTYAAANENAPSPVDFNFHIRPLLSEHCYPCHGPDEKTRKAKLRLDMDPSAASKAGQGKKLPVITPGKPAASELYARITSTDPDEVMPPPSAKLALADHQKDLIRRWIAQGAQYKKHWAFIPVGKVPVPAASTSSTNPIDAFIRYRLEREGLSPSRPASPETLVRRLSLDLRGLPPTVAEVDQFLSEGPAGFDRLVDRFLSSPAYGERQAMDWLDLARFADTFGYQADVDFDFSPWRDWVIAAFNQNLSYRDFIRWQVAGDLLPNASRETRLATAFNRLHRQTNEGGSIEEEFRAEYVADRVQTAGTAFLGLSLSCARCHDHKYDPITQKEFYQFAAFFNNIDESGLYSHFTRAAPTPGLLLYPPGVEEQHADLRRKIDDLEKALAGKRAEARQRFAAWTNTAPRIPLPSPVHHFAFDRVAANSTPDAITTNASFALHDSPQQAPGQTGTALQFSGDNFASAKNVGAFNRTTPFSFAFWIKPVERQPRAVILHYSRAWTDSGSRGYELLLENEKPTFSLIHFWPGNAIKVAATQSLPLGAWSHLTVSYDGTSRAAGIRLYLNGQPLPLEVVRDNLYKDITHRSQWGDSEVGQIELALAGRFRDSGFKNGLVDELQVFDQCLTPLEVRSLARPATPASDASPSDRAAAATAADLLDYYLERVDPPCREIATQLRALRRQENDLVNDVREIMVMRDSPTPRPTFTLQRGAYDAPGEQVQPGTPAAVLPFPSTAPRDRLGLADWLVDPRNPLTARVVVNRVWRQHFGRGLVTTEEDFGIQGKLPTNPELLDWLASWFVANGWDLKALHKLIVCSDTWKQVSEASPLLLTKDPENLLLARGPKHRLKAEEIRDSALAVAGILVTNIGGRSVKPYQPQGLWEQAGTGKQYVQDTGNDLFRRSLYTFWRRTAPPPSMLIFDAPTREVCIARREITSTPLQSLVLLNDPQFVEAARALAERTFRPELPLPERISLAFRTALARRPLAREQTVLSRLYEEQLSLFNGSPAGAEAFLKTGSRRYDTAIPAAELAAATVVSSAILNMDEFVTKR